MSWPDFEDILNKATLDGLGEDLTVTPAGSSLPVPVRGLVERGTDHVESGPDGVEAVARVDMVSVDEDDATARAALRERGSLVARENGQVFRVAGPGPSRGARATFELRRFEP